MSILKSEKTKRPEKTLNKHFIYDTVLFKIIFVDVNKSIHNIYAVITF